ncbi:MAG: Aminotransferase [Thermoproteota archaeon]|nr:Aminotransferase [Thermoproteota archaeon]
MVKEVAERVQTIERSLFYEIRDMISNYKDAISLTLGEPDFPTPKHIVEAGKEALDKGLTRYAGDTGSPILREKIAQKAKRDYGLDINAEKGVAITIGAAAANCTTIMSLINPGDEVITQSPYYPPYNTIVRLAGGIPKFLKLHEENGFQPASEEMERLVTDRTRLFFINNPSNPTGAVFEKETLETIADIAKRHDLYVLSDEVYEKFTYENTHFQSMASLSGMFERTIITNSFSKTYAMTGWRVGYAIGPPSLISQVVNVHYATNVSVPMMAQMAAVAALSGSQDCVEKMLSEYGRRRRIIVEGLNRIHGIKCSWPQGAFFVFPKIDFLNGRSLEFAKFLALEARVAVVPGVAFGSDGEGYMRLSYSASVDNINEALKRIGEATEKLV